MTVVLRSATRRDQRRVAVLVRCEVVAGSVPQNCGSSNPLNARPKCASIRGWKAWSSSTTAAWADPCTAIRMALRALDATPSCGVEPSIVEGAPAPRPSPRGSPRASPRRRHVGSADGRVRSAPRGSVIPRSARPDAPRTARSVSGRRSPPPCCLADVSEASAKGQRPVVLCPCGPHSHPPIPPPNRWRCRRRHSARHAPVGGGARRGRFWPSPRPLFVHRARANELCGRTRQAAAAVDLRRRGCRARPVARRERGLIRAGVLRSARAAARVGHPHAAPS
jgi:hypothetical protein